MQHRFANVPEEDLQLRNAFRLAAGVVMTVFFGVVAVIAPSDDASVARQETQQTAEPSAS